MTETSMIGILGSVSLHLALFIGISLGAEERTPRMAYAKVIDIGEFTIRIPAKHRPHHVGKDL